MKLLYHFAYPPATYEISSCFVSSPTLGNVSLFNLCYSSMGTVVSHCGFKLYCSNHQWCWDFVCLLTTHIFSFVWCLLKYYFILLWDCFIIIELQENTILSGYKSFFKYMPYRYFLLINSFPFSFPYVFGKLMVLVFLKSNLLIFPYGSSSLCAT